MNDEKIREAVLVYGLKVWCEKCGARGRWIPHPRLRLRQVACAVVLAGAELCNGNLRAAPRDPHTGKGQKFWPREVLAWRVRRDARTFRTIFAASQVEAGATIGGKPDAR